jgi:serine/threonine-protein kinase
MAAAALQEGDVFANRYRIVRELASGGMGAVYECVHTVTERRCALKVMLSHTVEREQLRKRFMQESRLAAQIGSEYIVDVLDAGVDDENKAPYLVMELLEGEDLGQRLLRQGPLSREETVSYLWHVALALDRTHQAGIVHRDLKASNLFLTRREDGTPLVKVLDFGIAKVLTVDRSGEHRTQTVGTPIYMAPEQFRADGRITPATDIYALGMLAYTLLVGVHYWTEEHSKCENPFAFASIAVHGPKDNPSARAARAKVSLPATFDGWFFRTTSRWPQDRFPSATSAVTELARSLDVEPPVLPAGMPATEAPASGARVATGNQLPTTIESPSGRVAAVRAPTPSAGAGVALPSTGSRENHTQVSLSVTSGELPFSLGPPKPAKNRSIAIGAGIGLVAAVIAAVAVSLRAGETHEVVRAGPAAYAPATQADNAATPTPAPPPSAAEAPAQNAAKSIEELPIAPADPIPIEALRPTVDDVARRPSPAPRTRPRGVERRTEPDPGSPVVPAASPPPADTKKPLDRDSLYGRY